MNKGPNGRFLYELRPDCSVYEMGTIASDAHRLDLSRADLVFEIKKELSADPFAEKAPDSKAEENTFVNNTSEILGQITAYASSILGSQYRTHAFMVLITGNLARLIRWDRSGAIVSDRIKFDEEPHLVKFLTQYDRANDEVRGRDTTVTPPTDEEISNAKNVVPELQEELSFLAITIPEPANGSKRRFIIPHPEPYPDIPVGRWTRPSFAFDVRDSCRVLLKDSWRVLVKDISPEGKIYELLHSHGVPNVPRCLLAADVGDDRHKSRTDEIKNTFFRNHVCWKIIPHQHYRMALGTIGTQLKNFRCTKDFVQAIFAALKGKVTVFF